MTKDKKVEFVIPFSLEDRYRHFHYRVKGKVIDFTVQYETLIKETWFPVVRYDSSHGFAHRDLINKDGKKRKTPLFITDKNEALTFAENDIKDNWEVYKIRFLKEVK